MQATGIDAYKTGGPWQKLAAAVVGLLGAVSLLTLCAAAHADEARGKLVGMYVHQHWPYHHPYAARTWTLEDWRGYAGGLQRLGYNAVLIWPVLETMPEPLTASDRANLRKIARVINMLHHQFGLRAYIALCPNVMARDDAAAKASFQQRHFFYCDARVDPGNPAAMQRLLERRARLLAPLKNMDGVAIIDSNRAATGLHQRAICESADGAPQPAGPTAAGDRAVLLDACRLAGVRALLPDG